MAGYHDPRERRIVLLGKSGTGKSSSGNTILGSGVFTAALSASSVTRECQKETREVEGTPVTVVDTPGFFDTHLPDDNIKREILRSIALSTPGPHAFLVVIKVGAFTVEEREASQIIKMFSEEALRHTMVVFTRGDQLQGKNIKTFLRENKHLKQFVQKCGGGYHVFNNSDINNSSQVSELLQKIERVVKKNGGACYTNEMFQFADAAIRGEQEMIQMEKYSRLSDKNNAIVNFVMKVIYVAEGLTVGIFMGALLGAKEGIALLSKASPTAQVVGVSALIILGTAAGAIVGGHAAAETDGEPVQAVTGAMKELQIKVREVFKAETENANSGGKRE